jgi:GxxExxY protein
MEKEPVFQLCDQIRETAWSLHHYLRHGHLEKVYENGLAHRLRKQGLNVKQQVPLTVHDENGVVLGEYIADLFIEFPLLIELKAVATITDAHVAQLLGYLRASRIEHGLLINFGASKLQIRKFAMSR